MIDGSSTFEETSGQPCGSRSYSIFAIDPRTPDIVASSTLTLSSTIQGAKLDVSNSIHNDFGPYIVTIKQKLDDYPTIESTLDIDILLTCTVTSTQISPEFTTPVVVYNLNDAQISRIMSMP